LISIVAWGGIGYGVYVVANKVAPGIHFIEALSSGDIAKAKTFTTGKFSDAELTNLSTTLKSQGEFRELKDEKATLVNDVVDAKGTAVFANGSKVVHMVIIKTPNGYKVDKLTIE
jgi:hypothetical protein